MITKNLGGVRRGTDRPRDLTCGVEPITKADHAHAVAAAAAPDCNNELTVILSSIANSMTACSNRNIRHARTCSIFRF
jgi:hypothetical protein